MNVLLRAARRHWLLGALLTVGVALRVVTWFAYQPALLYIDSSRYLYNLGDLDPTGLDPIGYTLILELLLRFGGLAFVVAVQHVVGICVAVALYALALRYNVSRWLAALVAAVPLLDAYQLQIEQNILTEVWFEALLVGMLWALLGRGAPNWRRSCLAGVLLGAAVVTRIIGTTIIVPVVLYLLVVGGTRLRNRFRRISWRTVAIRTGACLLGFAVVLTSYAGYFRAASGYWSLTGASTGVLYGRMATIADCDELPLNDTLRKFCPDEPLGERAGVDYYTHVVYDDPSWPAGLPPQADKPQLATEFGMTVLRNQPLDFAAATLRDFAKFFTWTKQEWPGDVPIQRWQFQRAYPVYEPGVPTALATTFDNMRPSVNTGLGTVLRGYQLSVGYVPGVLLGLAAAAAVVAGMGFGRARGSGLRAASLLSAGSGLIILLGSVAFEFSWRYELPALVLLPLGGALGATALLGRRGAESPERPTPAGGLAPFPEDTDATAVRRFQHRYGQRPFTALTVVVAAYNEESGIGKALRNMPEMCGDLPVSVLVVVDGATDHTAEVAAANGAMVCEAESNRGQGAALRLGYQLAVAGGADYIVTTDADGQYDSAELPALVEPLLHDTADFVTGSRRLGSEETDSRLRWLGVRVFAALASVLTWQRITDTSFGFRAMRADLARAVTLREPQYQASELLIGVLARGARLRELPMTMRLRNSGRSKKGAGLGYGVQYGRVMVGTWLREYVLRGRFPRR